MEFDSTNLDQAVALTGLSDSANVVGFYEADRWQVRLAYNWRDSFLLATNQLRSFGEPVFVDSYGQWDIGASFDINDNLTVFADGINLTDEISEGYGRFREQFIYAYHGGPRYTVGVRGTF